VAVVPVEKAAVYEYRSAVLGEHDIRLPSEILDMQPVAVAAGMQSFAHSQLRLGVARPDRHHVFAARLRAVHVDH
jgi:hypothetical protein